MVSVLVVLASITVAVIWGSVLEWLVHRFGYHEAAVWPVGTEAHRVHHELRYPAGGFFERGPTYRTSQPAWLETAYVAAHVPVLLALASANPAASIAATVTLAAYATAAHYVHPMTHMRRGRRWEQTRLFRHLVARHARHHQDIRINFNVVLPLGDWLFGTLDRPSGASERGAKATGV